MSWTTGIEGVTCNEFISQEIYLTTFENNLGITGFNPGPFTLDGTNTYLIGTGPRKLLIDTGEGVAEYENALKKAIRDTGTTLIANILITHRHKDHVGGIAQVLNVCKDMGLGEPQVHKRSVEGESNDTFLDIQDGDLFSVEGVTLKAIPTPGHTSDHTSFFWLEQRALFSGDCILGRGSTVFESLISYMQSLALLRTLEPQLIFPGHGPLIEEGMAKIDEYMAHRVARDQEILHLLSQHGRLTCQQLVDVIYKGYPPSVLPAAKFSISQHLTKLQQEKQIQLENDHYSSINTNS